MEIIKDWPGSDNIDDFELMIECESPSDVNILRGPPSSVRVSSSGTSSSVANLFASAS